MADSLAPNKVLRVPDGEYRRLFEDSRDAIYIATTSGRFLDVNPACVRLFGYASREEMFSLDLPGDLYWNPKARSSALSELEFRESIEEGEVEIRTKVGQRLRVQETVSAIRDEHGELFGFRSIVRDSTRQQSLEEQLRQSQKMAAIGRLAEGVAHDFNNLLTAINGYSELMLAQQSRDDPARNAVAEIATAGKRAADLTRRLLVLSRRQAYSPRRLDLNRVLADMEKLLRRVLGSHIVLQTQFEPTLNPVVADQGEIEQLILNLAIAAGCILAEGGELHLTLASEPASENREVKLICRAASFSSSKAMRGFSAAGGSEDRWSYPALIDSIVQRAGGHLEMDAGRSSGAVWEISLPSSVKHSHVSESQTGAQSLEGLDGSETVLLVEDEDSVRELVQRILALRGYRVLAARDAQGAMELCADLREGPELLLTDVVMPRINGPALATELKARFRDLKVLFISGYAGDSEGVRSPGLAPTAFLQKPFSPEVLASKVREVLDEPPVASH